MPYSKYAHDIFLSYRHLDNKSLDKEEIGWVTRLHQDLAARVAQWLGNDIGIWRDKRLQGNEDFSASILQSVVDVAAFVAIVTPSYAGSTWCSRELAAFISAAEKQGGIKLGTKTRFFKVLKTPVSLHEQPAPLRGLLGYEFFDDEKEFEFLPDPKLAKQLYRAKLDDLARDINLLLRQFAREATTNNQPAKTQNQQSVYLAWTTSDLQDSRDKIRRELLDRNYDVVPDADPPLRADSLTGSVRRALEHCRLSIHPIGGNFGMVPEGDSRSLGWLQHDLATERYKKGAFNRILWMPQDLAVTDDKQRDFLGRIEEEIGGSSNGFSLLKTTLEELKSIVIKQLDDEPTKATPKAPSSQGRRHVYLVCERADHDAVQPLTAYLRQRGCAFNLPLSNGDPSEIRSDHQETLCACDAVLLYHGAGSEAWLREKMRDCRKVFGWGREKPFLASGVYLGPKPEPSKLDFQNDDFLVCRSLETISPQALDPFIAALSESGEPRQ